MCLCVIRKISSIFAIKLFSYMTNDSLYKIKDWIDDQQKRGRITFPYQEVITQFPAITEQHI